MRGPFIAQSVVQCAKNMPFLYDLLAYLSKLSLLCHPKVKRPYFLAGGLNPENVRDALQKIHPYALDVSSGIETGGLKDAEKMKIFMDIVRKEEKE